MCVRLTPVELYFGNAPVKNRGWRRGCASVELVRPRLFIKAGSCLVIGECGCVVVEHLRHTRCRGGGIQSSSQVSLACRPRQPTAVAAAPDDHLGHICKVVEHMCGKIIFNFKVKNI